MNIRETRIIDITDKEGNVKSYTVTKLPATKANKVYKKLATSGMDSLDEDDVKSLIVESCAMKPETFEYEFSGRMVALYKLVGEILQFNFEDVFQELGLEEDNQSS